MLGLIPPDDDQKPDDAGPKPAHDVTSRAGISRMIADHMAGPTKARDEAMAAFKAAKSALVDASALPTKGKGAAKNKAALKAAQEAEAKAGEEFSRASDAYWAAKDQRRAILRDAIKDAPKSGAIKYHGMTDAEPSREMTIDGVTFHWPDTDAGHLTAADSLLYVAENPIAEKLWQATGRVVHSTQRNSADSYWEKKYGMAGFVSAATGGDGTTVLYNGNKADKHIFTHEAGHNLATKIWGSTHPKTDSDYAKAQKEEDPVSAYGANSPAEDFAEAVSMYSLPEASESFQSFKRQFPKKYAAIHDLLKE